MVPAGERLRHVRQQGQENQGPAQGRSPAAIQPSVRTGPSRATPPPGGVPRLRAKAEKILARADIAIGGDRPWDLQVHDDRLYRRCFTQGALGLGEAYMEGWWDVEALDVFFHRLLSARIEERFDHTMPVLRDALRNAVFNLQRGSRALGIGRHHYDIGNDLYRAMLDERMVYSCGYWRTARDLDAAQEAKLDLICRKLHLGPGMRLLDIGCGWGSLVRYAAEHYDVEAVGITVSRAQAALAEERCQDLPVTIRFQDFKTLKDETFDRVVSVGMFEHVGHKNHRAYMAAVHRVLAPDGLHLLHTIARPKTSVGMDPWVTRYIFPQSMLPSFLQIARAADRLFVIEDVHNIGRHYDPTLMAWFRNFDREWEVIRQTGPGYDETFYRMWKYYLLSAAGSFRAGRLAVWQVVLAKDRTLPTGYMPVR